MDSASHQAEGFNPLCGNRLHLYLKVNDVVPATCGFQGSGCANSKASASIGDGQRPEGAPGGGARRSLFRRFHTMVTTPPDELVGGHGEAVRAGRRARISGAREVRGPPSLAHAESRARARPNRLEPNRRKMKPSRWSPMFRAQPPPTSNDAAALDRGSARTEALKPAILEAIQTSLDPEIPVNIWELALTRRHRGWPQAWPRAHDAHRAWLPGGAVTTRRSRREGQGRARRDRREGWPRSCGIRHQPRAACPRSRSSSWGCGDAAPVEDLDGHETSHGAGRCAVGRAREIAEAYEASYRADGEGAAAAGAPRPAVRLTRARGAATACRVRPR